MYVLYTRLTRSSEQRFRALPSAGLPLAYRERLTRMKSIAAHARTRAGLWLLEQGLRVLGEDDTGIARLGVNTDGRPHIAGGPVFNISHSQSLVACAIDRNRAVGLDVEARRPTVPTRLSRLLTDQEKRAVVANPRLFYDFWCAREATVKATGRAGLARIRQLTLHDTFAMLDEQEWALKPIELHQDYAACLASDRPIDRIDIVERFIPNPFD